MALIAAATLSVGAVRDISGTPPFLAHALDRLIDSRVDAAFDRFNTGQPHRFAAPSLAVN